MACQAPVIVTMLLCVVCGRADEIPLNRNTLPGVKYVGSGRCLGCHPKIYNRYRATAMGRSMTAASDALELKRVSAPVVFFSAELNRYFEVYREGASAYQAEYELNAAGETAF